MPLDNSLKIEDIAWDRLKVRAGDSSKIVSISEILRVPVVRIFAQRAYAAGSPASVRIITADSKSGNPLRDTRVKLELMNGDAATTLFTGRTDGFGTAQIAFTLPADNFGSRQLRVTADTALGTVTDGTLGYWIRAGNHSMTRDDWKVFTDYAAKHLKK